MAITISSSMRVKPDALLLVGCFCITISYKKFIDCGNVLDIN